MMSTVAALSWSVTKIVLRTVGIKERSFMCGSITVHVQLVSQVQRYLMCTLTICTLQVLYRNYIISSLHTDIHHGIPELLFSIFVNVMHGCGNFNDCPSVLNHLLKSNCFHLPLPLYILLDIAFLILLH